MKGVFVSYSRADQPVARRVRNGLVSLGIEVLWDENMPGVDWQEFLEHSIDEITAVVVLWTPQSYKSGSVRDEARLGLDKGKLVNILSGVDRPRFPYDRINGLAIDSWVAGEPDSGWSRLVSTLDARLAAAGAIARPGIVTAALTAQLKDVADRRAALARLERAASRALREEASAERDLTRAEQGVVEAQGQLDHVKAIAASKSVMAAAFADRDEASVALAQANSALALARTAAEQSGEQLEHAQANLRGYLISIGGRIEGEADVDPFALEAESVGPLSADAPDRFEEDARQEATADPTPPRGETLAIPPPPPPPPPTDDRRRPAASPADPHQAPPLQLPNLAGLWSNVVRLSVPSSVRAALVALVVVAATAWAATAMWGNGPDTVPPPSSAPAIATPTSPSTAPAASASPSPVLAGTKARSAWIVGSWAQMGQRQSCNSAMRIAHADGTDQLVFTYPGPTPPDRVDYAIVSSDPPVVETDEYRFQLIDPRHIKARGRKSGTVLEFAKCGN